MNKKKTLCCRRPMRNERSIRQTQTEQNASVNDSLTCDVRVRCSWLMLMVWSQRASICFTHRNGNRYQSNSLFTNCARIIFSSTYYFVCPFICMCVFLSPSFPHSTHWHIHLRLINWIYIFFEYVKCEVKWSEVFSINIYNPFTIHKQMYVLCLKAKSDRCSKQKVIATTMTATQWRRFVRLITR